MAEAKLFTDVAHLVRSGTSTTGFQVGTETKLRMYGLYKRATVGKLMCPNDKEEQLLSGERPSSRPSLWNAVDRSKYDAWAKCDELTISQARMEYIRLAAAMDSRTGRECLRLLTAHTKGDTAAHDKTDDNDDDVAGYDDTVEEMSRMTLTSDSEQSGSNGDAMNSTPPTSEVKDGATLLSAPSKPRTTLVERWTGIRPMIPRGQLDIDMSDLMYALWQCVAAIVGRWLALAMPLSVLRPSFSESSSSERWEEKVAKIWTNRCGSRPAAESCVPDETVLVGLSTPSLFDQFLSARSYPPGSQIIVTPPVSTPSLVHVMRFHSLEVVPVDLAPSDNTDAAESSLVVTVDLDALQQAITDKTVAILLVHPFGIVSATDTQLDNLRRHMAASFPNQQIDLIEDCSDCFSALSGPNLYLGSPHANASFFSFDPMKTSTALGGGIAVLRGTDVGVKTGAAMKRVRDSMYGQQSYFDFLVTVSYFALLHLISQSPSLCGLVFALCTKFGINYDQLIAQTTKFFAGGKRVTSDWRGSSKQRENQIFHHCMKDMMDAMRKRPSPSMLALLHRRLRNSPNHTESRTRSRMLQGLAFADALAGFRQRADDGQEKHKGVAVLTGPKGLHLNTWIYPVLVSNPDDVCDRMRNQGYDMTCAASHLSPVTSLLGTGEPNHESVKLHCCPRTENIMSSIICLPSFDRVMTGDHVRNMAFLLQAGERTKSLQISGSDNKTAYGFQNCTSFPLLKNEWVVSLLCFFLVVDALMFQMVPVVSTVSRFAIYIWVAMLFSGAVLSWWLGPIHVAMYNTFAKYSFLLCDSNRCGDVGRNGDSDHDERFRRRELEEPTQSCRVLDIHPLKVVDRSGQEASSVLLTGATGFVGSLLLRELLYFREKLNIHQVVVICRRKGKMDAETRIQDLLTGPMFNFLSDEEKASRVEVVEGDICHSNLGLTQSSLSTLLELPISHVFHCAASVRFDQALNEAAAANITPALHLQALSRKFRQGAGPETSKFVFVSTAFVHGDETGSEAQPLPERVFPLDPYSATEIYRSMRESQSYASFVMHKFGFPNTYTFSKCVCEHLLMAHQDHNTLIIRPSIVGPSLQVPFEGWSGERPTTLVSAACLYLKQLRLWHVTSSNVSCIPVDVVCRFLLSKAFQPPRGSPFESEGRMSLRYFSSAQKKGQEELLARNENIHNATWSKSSSSNALFNWLDFVIATAKTGVVTDYISRPAAYAAIFFTVKISPWLEIHTFQFIHDVMVKLPLGVICRFGHYVGWGPRALENLKRLGQFLDLPLLFFPFTNRSFCFDSALDAPEDLDGERYMMNCVLAAVDFLTRSEAGRRNMTPVHPADSEKGNAGSFLRIAGEHHQPQTGDLWWAVTQPHGNIVVRLIGFVLRKLFRYTCDEITVDMATFSALASAANPKCEQGKSGSAHHVVIVPTHRSLFDFLVISFLSFAVPELGLKLPHIAAADDFARIPLVGWFARCAQAFFLRRGGSKSDPRLQSQVQKIKDSDSGRSSCFEVFIEGTRSRDRRFVTPKTGFLRCLVASGGDHVFIPLTINYEQLPDHLALVREANGEPRESLTLGGLLRWVLGVMRGGVRVGRIHISSGEALFTGCDSDTDIRALTHNIQKVQKKTICVSPFHLLAASKALRVDVSILSDAVNTLGCKLWPSSCPSSAEAPVTTSEEWTAFLHFGHLFAPHIAASKPQWAQWLDHDVQTGTSTVGGPVAAVTNALVGCFELAEKSVAETIQDLRKKGFRNPSQEHILQYAAMVSSSPMILLRAAISIREFDVGSGSSKTTQSKDLMKLADAWSDKATNDKLESSLLADNGLGMWGYTDSRFVVKVKRDGSKLVTMTGKRYGISERSLRHLIPYLERESGIKINPLVSGLPMVVTAPDVPTSALDDGDREKLLSCLGNDSQRLSTSAVDRLRHGTGHSQEDVFLIRSGGQHKLRVPDAVVWPMDEKEVEAVVSFAECANICLIPFGGGTNVSHATRCPSKESEPRPIVSVDMRRMDQILWINEEDNVAMVQAGVTGAKLVEEMKARGYTIGHEPDSLEFSTLGGWIATKASGMKRNRYGNIEDIVRAVRVVGPMGLIWQGNVNGSAHGRVSTGFDLSSLMLGSEGNFGIVTSAVVKLWKIPECSAYQSILFPSFADGLKFARAAARMGRIKPASLRLLDNEQFRLGMALRADKVGMDWVASTVAKSLLQLSSFSPNKMACATIVFEGSKDEVSLQEKTVRNLAKQHGGVFGGSTNGKAGYDLTFAIAYLRDFALSYNFLAESFETFAPWSAIDQLIAETKERIKREHCDRRLPGNPMVSSRVTQLYDEGACVYFYFCMNVENVEDPSGTFTKIEKAARETIMENGGSLSHHHGIGKLRASFMDEVNSTNLNSMLGAMKRSVDPKNTFGARNGAFAESHAEE